MSVLEASHTVEILRDAGPQGLHINELARKADQIRLGDIAYAPDCSGPRLRRGRVRGPATAIVRTRARATERRRTLTLASSGEAALASGFEVDFDAPRRLVIR